MWQEAAHYSRLAWGLRRAVRYPAHANPEAALRAQLQRREASFLQLAERIVFRNHGHPYRRLFDAAGCSLADLRSLVAARGLEGALEALRQAGVRLTLAEFKGREPVVRGGLHLQVQPADFVNPLAAGAWYSYTAGSTGRRTVVPESLAHYAHVECYEALSFQQLGAGQRHWLTLNPLLPAVWGFSRPIFWQKRGYRPRRWYAAGDRRLETAPYRLASALLAAELRCLGAPVAPINYLPPHDFSPVARELAAARSAGRLGFVTGTVSSCVRVAAAALDHGLDIAGTRFLTAAEALSRAKADIVRRAGAEAFATYWVSEIGILGTACPHYAGLNAVHLFRDATALVAHRRAVAGTDVQVNSLLFTTLLPRGSFFLINLEVGDHAEAVPADCDCVYSRVGFDTVLSDISSFDKLTGHGATLVGNDILHILERVLPARFGGTPMDYQLVEEEGAGDTRIVLYVHPRIGPADADELRECFLTEIRGLFGGALTTRMWRHADAVVIRRAAPVVGGVDKVLPLRYLGSLDR